MLFTLTTGTTLEQWDTAQIVVQSVEAGERTVLVKGGSDGRYVSTGHLLYTVGGTVFAVPFDLPRLRTDGTPSPVIEGMRPTGAKYQLAKNDVAQLDHHPVWSRDGKQLFYVPTPQALASVAVSTDPIFSFGNPTRISRRFTEMGSQIFVRNYDVAPDSKIIGLVTAEEAESTSASRVEFRMVLNWFEELTQRVPAR